jgi:DNA modification methylase
LAGSRPNDIVLDPFMGSGTTAQVAIQHGRQYLGCELNQEYGDLQQERITKATPQKTDEAQMSLLDPLSAEA